MADVHLEYSQDTLFLYITELCVNNELTEYLSSVVCEQQRRRPACTSAQSDQRICYSLMGKYHTKHAIGKISISS